MRIRCPACFAEFALEQALSDEAARELMGVLADLPREVSRPLAAYLGLWRSRSRALAWERALRIAREALALHADAGVLAVALSETVEAIRAKQAEPGWKPMTGHKYLERVLESVAARGMSRVQHSAAPAPAKPASRTAQAMVEVERWRRGE